MKPIDYLLITLILVLTVFAVMYVSAKLKKPKERGVPSNSKRVLALILDHLPVVLLLLAIFIVRFYTSKEYGEAFKEYFNNHIEKGGVVFKEDIIAFFIKVVVLGYAFSALGDIIFGHSLGKRLMDLHIVSTSNSFLLRLVRALVKPFAVILLPVSIALSSSSKRRQQLHELLSKTWLEERPT